LNFSSFFICSTPFFIFSGAVAAPCIVNPASTTGLVIALPTALTT
jgi:hypothetical protein